MPWKDVPSEDLAKHQHYGVWGWLMTFYVISVLNFLNGMADFFSPDPTALKMFFDMPNMLMAVSAVMLALQLPFLILVPLRHPLMVNASIVSTWIHVIIMLPFTLSIDVTLDAPESLGVVIAAGTLAISGLWTWYLLSSKRVNVTFRLRVPAHQFPQ